MNLSQMTNAQLLHWINMVSFSVVDITEYLDTHPDDKTPLITLITIWICDGMPYAFMPNALVH